MKANRFAASITLTTLMMVIPATAGAQLSTAAMPAVVGQTVWLTSSDGRITKGKVLQQTAESIEVGGDGGATTQLGIADVRRVQSPDSVTNGVVKGALSLGLAGLLIGTIADAGDAVGQVFGSSLVILLGGQVEPIRPSNHYVTGALVGVAAGALLGYALDSGKVKTLYEREDGGLSVAVRPMLSETGNGVGVRVRW